MDTAQGLSVIRAAPTAERERTYTELARIARIQWDFKDLEEPVTLAKELALQHHYHPGMADDCLLYTYLRL